MANGPPTLWGGDAGFVCERLVANGEPDGGNAAMLNIAGQSLGGNVRSGPGVNFSDVGGLAEFTPITIVANTGVHFNGYDWFEIVHQGRTVYQWGGIMCADGGTPGILVACENARELLYPDTGSSDSSFSGARSWGGNVRSGPGADYARLGSIAEGVPVTVVRNTGVSFNGYDWYEIEFNGQTGFHWGGIMCSDNDNLPGSFSPCTNNPEL